MRVKSVAFGVGSLALLVLAQLAASQAVVSPESVKQKIETLAKEYQCIPSKDWKARRDFCIRLIDDGLICRGCKVSEVVAIFGDDVRLNEATDYIESGGVVKFEKPVDPSGYKQERFGWTLAFSSPSNGVIRDYYLTNSGK
jgi:hypothetical protein